jgi:hypothetical protein
VLSKARARFGNDVFEEFFRQSIELCRQAGLMEEGPVYVDSTLMRANASVDSLAPRADVARPPLSVTEYLHRLDQDEATPPDEDPPASGPPSTGGPLRRPNRALQSRTDPEATLVNRPDFGRHLAYKAHMAVAGRRGQVITAAVATTGAEADEHLLADVLWHHRRLSKQTIPATVADAKYGTTLNYLYLEHASIPAFIPTTRFGNQHSGIWGREHFQWLPDEDAFLCPAGERLRRHSNQPGTQRVRYQASKGSCVACPFRAQCAPSGTERSLHRSWALDLVEAAQERVASPLGKRWLVERKTYIEGTFGLAKELHGLRRTRFRGRRRVQIQVWLTAAAMNIKRAVRSRTWTPAPAAALRLLAWLQTSWRTATWLAPRIAPT